MRYSPPRRSLDTASLTRSVPAYAWPTDNRVAPLYTLSCAGDAADKPLPQSQIENPRPGQQTGSPGGNGKSTDIRLRLGGLILIAVAVSAVCRLGHLVRPDARGPGSALEYLLAMLGFACACAGSVMAILGKHLFDAVALSERWQPHR